MQGGRSKHRLPRLLCQPWIAAQARKPTPEEPAEQEQPQNGMGGLLIFLVVGLLGGGAALYYVKFMKPKQNVKGSTDLDEFDFDEYDEDEPEEKLTAQTPNRRTRKNETCDL